MAQQNRVHRISSSQIEYRGNQDYIAEASSIGLGPGDWPEHILVTSNTQPDMLFRKFKSIAQDGNLLYVSYIAAAVYGLNYLAVFND